MLFSGELFAQATFTISGKVVESVNGETAFGTSIYLKGTTIGTTSNEYGFYSITAPKGKYTIVVSYIGFTDINKEIELNQNLKLDFELTEDQTQLDEVVITAEEPELISIRSPQMSVSKVKISTIKKMPVVLGEVDILKSIQLLPGVTNTGEASGGFNVRGGAVDQNLVLLDEAIIYNTSHLLGYFSVFNADAIKDLKLYKGNIPARFGGRVSSVLDVRQKDGNKNNYQVSGGIGLVSSRLAAEGPMFSNKGSFLLAGRGSYAHLFLKAAGEENSAKFYDLNLKTNYQLNDKNKLYLSGYFGRDNFEFEGGFDNNYGSMFTNLRWNHLFNDKLFSNMSLIFSDYTYKLSIGTFEFEWLSGIKNYNLKYDLSYYTNEKLSFIFGADVVYYDFDPGTLRPTTQTSAINRMQLDKKKALESGLYINATHKISDRLTAQYGMRYSYFSRLGGQSLNNYQNNQSVVFNETLGIYEAGTVIDQTTYKNGDAIKTYSNFEPRLGLSYQLNESSSLKAGYSRTAQYIHLLSNTTAVTPLDVWTPSGKFVKPQLSDQFALGYFRNFKDRTYSFEAEAYYRTVDNRIDYIDGSDLIAKNNIETEILNGESRAYGLELLFRKTKGRLTGLIGYTFSKSEQRTLGGTAGGPGINNGRWYYTPQDRTHDFSLTGNYKLHDKWSISSNFIFQTGRPVTYPNAQYQYEDISVANYSERNANRLTNYHRLDISATYVPNRKPNNKWKGEWVFGIYNVYNRKNAAAVSFGQNRETGLNEATRTAIFGIIPSISYNFKF